MQTQWEQSKIFIITILAISSVSLLFLIFTLDKLPQIATYIHILIFATAITLLVHYAQNKKLLSLCLYLVIMIVYNPFINLLPNIELWKIAHIAVLIIFLKSIFELSYADKLNETTRIAFKLNNYLIDLERQISHLTFHETIMVIKREYAKNYRLENDKVSWQDRDFPDFEFYILSTYYAQGQKKKGGISAKGKNEFKNIEIHINFNLTHHVKYAVREKEGSLKTSLYGKKLKLLLVKKFQYVDLAKVIDF
ncbi:hypothetical protein [Candidatus Berkiella aquae]|uniref:Uncharacterized protein n=1 Tax=Candidatus Berkiella aquae TaxID=295108 RepID=A0A0Q9YIM1_9GAMM|nr:hypothetical protein [Candidatus Berkiella aquae]MCS5712198.1 hypothetical protein [Candidatus Berkiella aquae]